MTEEQRRYKCDYDIFIRETSVSKRSELEFVERSPPGVSTNNSKTSDKPTYNKSTSRADGPFCTISVQHHTRTIDVNGVSNTVSINQATPAPCNNTNGLLGEGRFAVEGKREIKNSDYRAPKGRVAKSNRSSSDNRPIRSVLAASENIALHQPGERNDPEVCGDNDERSTPELFELER